MVQEICRHIITSISKFLIALYDYYVLYNCLFLAPVFFPNAYAQSPSLQ